MAEDSAASSMTSNKRLLQQEASLAAFNSSELHLIPKETRHLVTVAGFFPSGEKQLSKEFQDPFKNFIIILGHLSVEDVV